MSEFTMDWERPRRTGLPEAVHSEAKTAEQIAAIVAAAEGEGRPLLFTRLPRETMAALTRDVAAKLDYDPASRTAVLGTPPAATRAGVGIVAAGTSDLPVAHEARRTLRFHGVEASIIADVGVAGLWRLMARLPEIEAHRVVIAIAGMEGALFTVLGGLIAAPIIAVPTSVGYGVAADGAASLRSALASCSPGILAVNIDNGYGAAAAALRILGPADA